MSKRSSTYGTPVSMLFLHMSADAAARMDIVKAEWPTTAGQWVRFAGNFVNLTTLLGLAIAKLGRATIRRGPRGLFLCEGYKLKFPIAGAFTVGNVITTGSTWDAMISRFPQLLQHEERHTWHYLACIGLPFYPAYTICMGWSMLRTGDRAAQNLFERDAGLAIGGYEDHPIRPVRVNVKAMIDRISRS